MTSSASTSAETKSSSSLEHFRDLDPDITYRHILSPPPGARDPLRVIALCDSDAFYAACEQVRLGIDPERPLVVRQWEALIAANYPARKYGISRMSKWRDAVKKCPELIVVHVATYKEGDHEPTYRDNPDTNTHKISLDFYRRESGKILSIFKEGLPNGEIEKASIDEAFIDFTRPVREKLLERYPYLAQVPPDAPHGIDTVLPKPPPISWQDRGIVIPINPPDDAASPAESGQEADGKEAETTWHDVALSIAAEIMNDIRAAVRTKLGYTTSAGIARNKFLAKLTASYRKFDSQSILRNAAIPNYLRPLPFQKIRFLGGKLGQAVADEYSASTVGDLLEDIQRRFGEDSIWIYELFHGIDRSEVKEKPPLTKSMMAAKNLPHPITKVSDGPQWLRVLAAELALRLNDLRRESLSVWPRTIVLHVRRAGPDQRLSKQMAFPFVNEVTVDVVASYADKLWRDLVGTDNSVSIKVTHIALNFSGVEAGELGQQSIEGFFPSGSSSKPSSRVEEPKRKRPEEDGEVDPAASRSFLCSRCQKRIALSADEACGDEDAMAAVLVRKRVEHDDFHFAQDLSRTADARAGGAGLRLSDEPPPPRKRKKTGKEKEDVGIAKFFTRR
ncbi:hypothetical protein OF83DRAFT_1296428 [Amylostereum chailletii]|nr:hypothetical protein OF83DRAFT_1296428 [Amylostereum chailletii]